LLFSMCDPSYRPYTML